MAGEKIRYPTPALEKLRAATDGMTQTKIAERLGCSQAMVSEYLGGRSRPGPAGRALAFRHFEVPLDAWFLPDELPSDPSDSDDEKTKPHGARTSSIPPRSEPPHADACPAGEAA